MDKLTKQLANTMPMQDVYSITEEESAELIKACSKYLRANGIGMPTPKSVEETTTDLIEEMADVTLCLDILYYSL